MIFSHLSYCITTWSQAYPTTIKPITALYNRSMKIMDKKPVRWHHCQILEKHHMFNFDSFIDFSNLKLLFKCIHGHAPSLLSDSITRHQLTNKLNTRATENGDLREPFRYTTFGKSTFSVKGVTLWNTLPTEIKMEQDISAFNSCVKTWLKQKQQCTHV